MSPRPGNAKSTRSHASVSVGSRSSVMTMTAIAIQYAISTTTVIDGHDCAICQTTESPLAAVPRGRGMAEDPLRALHAYFELILHSVSVGREAPS